MRWNRPRTEINRGSFRRAAAAPDDLLLSAGSRKDPPIRRLAGAGSLVGIDPRRLLGKSGGTPAVRSGGRRVDSRTAWEARHGRRGTSVGPGLL